MFHRGPLTIYPRDCAMRGAWELTCFGGYLVLFPPVRSCGQRQRLRAYWSPNGTPWHHRMRPLVRAKRASTCSCGEATCPCPSQPASETEGT